MKHARSSISRHPRAGGGPELDSRFRGNDSKISFEDLGFSKTEPHRISRQGFPEAIYCPGKTTEQIVKIFGSLCKGPGPVLATRTTPEVAQAIQKAYPKAAYHSQARLVVWGARRIEAKTKVVVATRGTSDLPVADAAAVTADALGRHGVGLVVEGGAGKHRLLGNWNDIEKDVFGVVSCVGVG